VLFFEGWLLHVWLQAEASVRSQSNGVTTLRKWLTLNRAAVVARGFLGLMVLLLWNSSPQILGNLQLPHNYGMAGFFGFAADAFIDKVTFILGMKVEVPQLAPPEKTTP